MMRKLPSLLAFSVCSALLLVACGGGGSNTANNANTAATNTAATNTAASNTSTASTSGDKIGVAECDEYIAKWEACVNSKVPEGMRGSFKGAFETNRNSWRQLATTAQGKAELAQACKSAHEQAKQAFGSYGCTW